MVYQVQRQRTILFGGQDARGGRFADTWEWNGATWTQVAATGPTARWNYAMAYDEARQRVVIFGGNDASQVFRDTWEWDGFQWMQRVTPTAPTARFGAAMAYDGNRGTLILFGGVDLTATPQFLRDTWEWDGQSWNLLQPSNAPGRRYAHSMVWDSHRERIVLFGGTLDLGGVYGPYQHDTWEWFGGGWTFRLEHNPPDPRAWAPLAYDSRARKTLVFGGTAEPWATVGPRYLANDTWEYEHVWDASYASFGPICLAGSTWPVLDAEPGALPWRGEPFTLRLASLPPSAPAVIGLGVSRTQWAGVPLPFSLAGFGLASCELLVSLDLLAPAANPGGTARLTLPLPAPGAFGSFGPLTFYQQGLVLDSRSPPGFNVSNGGMAVAGLK